MAARATVGWMEEIVAWIGEKRGSRPEGVHRDRAGNREGS
jgi:hypothetical protein